MPILEIFSIFAVGNSSAQLNLKLNVMRFKKDYVSAIERLGTLSQELYLYSMWTKEGFSESAFLSWLGSVSDFMEIALEHRPYDLIEDSTKK